jgi:hypothetical protein
MHHYLQLVAEVSFWQEPLRQLEKIEQVAGMVLQTQMKFINAHPIR